VRRDDFLRQRDPRRSAEVNRRAIVIRLSPKANAFRDASIPQTATNEPKRDDPQDAEATACLALIAPD
jgi:hypothetical protein